ncbi:aldehyde dehydrogenase family protein [Neobacillus niacini]|uniref:aldehyde dehydrogenase family protein n=1 Tax=Neobacillus niacini TaxID=86668 RepID=UPI002FFEA8FE
MSAQKVQVKEIQLLINNQDVSTENYVEVRDPGRLTDVVGRVAQARVEHVNEAVEAAHAAFQTWRHTSLDERLAVLYKIEYLLKEEATELAATLSRENGVLYSTSLGEIDMAVRAIQATVKNVKSFFEPVIKEDGDSWVSVEKRPIGVIAGIIPWNAPMVLTMQKVAPAIVTGNTLVMKPSPNSPMGVSMILKKVASFLPPGVINVIHGDAEVGSALNKHRLVRKISFTGGGQIAKYIMKDAADSLKNVHFELGGNDPAIVLNDADIDDIIPKIVGSAFRRSGQVCFAIKRVYVPETLYDIFYEKICQFVSQYKIGHGLDERATFAPVNNKNQYDSVNKLIERIKNSNAQLVQLGEKLEPENWDNGYYIQPAVVRDVDPKQEIVTCEQFGPIIPLVSYRNEEEVVNMANDTEYGLGSSIWTSNFERGLRIARQIEAGMTFINGAGQSHLGYESMPFGGVKQSGIGRENSDIGLVEFIEYHAINYHK